MEKSKEGLIPAEEVYSEPPPSYDQAVQQQSSVSPQISRNVNTEHLPEVAPVPTASSSGSLQKPIAIPATAPKLGSPYLRAYPPALQNFNLSREDFLMFIDTLNRVAVQSPPLQVLSLAGTAVSFVPEHNLNLIGGAIDLGSKLVGRAISKGRTELFLRKANREIFQPRGLKIEVAKFEALAKLAGIPVLLADGTVDKKAPLLGAIEDHSESETLSTQQRRLQAMEPWIAALETSNLPDLTRKTNPFSQWKAQTSEWQRKREEKRAAKPRNKRVKRFDKKVAKAERKYEKRMRKAELKNPAGPEGRSEMREEEFQRRKEKVERLYDKRVAKAEDRIAHSKREERGLKRITWLLVRPVDANSGLGENPDLGSDFSFDEESFGTQSGSESGSDSALSGDDGGYRSADVKY